MEIIYDDRINAKDMFALIESSRFESPADFLAITTDGDKLEKLADEVIMEAPTHTIAVNVNIPVLKTVQIPAPYGPANSADYLLMRITQENLFSKKLISYGIIKGFDNHLGLFKSVSTDFELTVDTYFISASLANFGSETLHMETQLDIRGKFIGFAVIPRFSYLFHTRLPVEIETVDSQHNSLAQQWYDKHSSEGIVTSMYRKLRENNKAIKEMQSAMRGVNSNTITETVIDKQ